jgi:hypothetical protein
MYFAEFLEMKAPEIIILRVRLYSLDRNKLELELEKLISEKTEDL